MPHKALYRALSPKGNHDMYVFDINQWAILGICMHIALSKTSSIASLILRWRGEIRYTYFRTCSYSSVNFFPNLRSQGFKIKIFKYFKKKLKHILSYTFKPTAGRPQLFCLVDRN